MRILIVNSEYPPLGGGAGNASSHIARELAALGHQVFVLTSTFKNLANDEMLDGVRILRIPALRRHFDRSNAIEQLIYMLSAIIWGYFWRLKLKPNAILAFFGAPSGVAAWVWNVFGKVPYVVLLRGGDVPGFRPYDFGTLHRLMAPILRRVWRGAAAVVANSQGLRDLGTAFEPAVPIQVIPNGVVQFKDQKKRPWNPTRMLFVGRLVYQKGLDILLDALAETKKLDWQLTLVGDGPRRQWLSERVQSLGLADRIAFRGWLTREELPAAYSDANLFVYPSRHEGMPNALLEAMSAGLPSIATRIAGNEELIEDGLNGYLVESEDVGQLKARLLQLIPDQEERKKMGAAAQAKAQEEYTWKAVGQAYSDLLHQISPS